MKATQHVEYLLRQGRKPIWPVRVIQERPLRKAAMKKNRSHYFSQFI